MGSSRLPQTCFEQQLAALDFGQKIGFDAESCAYVATQIQDSRPYSNFRQRVSRGVIRKSSTIRTDELKGDDAAMTDQSWEAAEPSIEGVRKGRKTVVSAHGRWNELESSPKLLIRSGPC